MTIRHSGNDYTMKVTFICFKDSLCRCHAIIKLLRLCMLTFSLRLISAICNTNLSRREKIYLIKTFLLTEVHGFLFEIFQEIFCYVVFLTCKRINRALHKVLSFNSKSTNAVDDNVGMNIAGAVMSIRMRTDNCLMPRKVFLGKYNS